MITVTALRASMRDLLQASIIGAVVTNSLLMLGGSFLLTRISRPAQDSVRTSRRPSITVVP